MARRGFLDYVLGGAVGGLEGLAQKRAAEEERKRMADAAAMDQARFLISSGFRIAPPETEDPAARSILPPLEMPSTTRSSLSPMTMPSTAPRPSAGASKALSAALNLGMGVDPTKSSLSRGLNVDPLAMDRSGSNMMEMFERAKQTRAAQDAIAASVTLPGGQKVRFNAPESDDAKLDRELRKYEAQQGVITARQKAEQDRANRGFFAILSRAKALPEGVTYEEVQDIDLKPFFQEYSQGRSAEAAYSRAQLNANAQAGMVNIVEGIDPTTGRPTLIQAPRGGGSLRLTGFDAPPSSSTGGKIPPADKKSMVELEASIKELDKALESVKASPKAFGIKTALPNMALTRTQGVKPRADVVGAIVKLRRTEFGTAMSRQEKESGESLFPAGGDEAPTLIDKLTALREKAQLELDTKREYYGTQPAAAPSAPAPAGSGGRKPALTIDQWMDANPQRAGESDEAYMARARTSREGK